MKPPSNSLAAPARHLAAALFLSALPATAQTITNPSFEANTFTVFPGYVSANTAITGWTAVKPDRLGLNPSNGSDPNNANPFANNGAVPDGLNVAFMQNSASGAVSLSTTVTGLVVGTKYNVSARVNARNNNQPHLTFTTDGTGPAVTLLLAPVAAAKDTTTPYSTAAFEFTATATSQTITFANTRPDGDHTALFDNVKIAPSANEWSIAPWTNDADSGIDSQYIYTHAYSFGSDAPVTVNDVNFLGRESNTPGRFTTTGLAAVYGNGPNNLTGDSLALAKDFRYNGSPSITLDNLKPNTEYVFTAYGFGWDAGGTPRSSTFSSSVPGSQKLSVNLNQYGQGNGILVNYRYTTDATGAPVTISYPANSTNTYHTSGFSNREAVPATQPEHWTVEPWYDDATSGVTPNHNYTHAINLGDPNGLNLNGINFTGIDGFNPAGDNYTTSGLPSQYNGDVNAITGNGSAMAKNFLYNGYPETINLSGLTPGKGYVFTFYSVGWDDGLRRIAFIGDVGEQATILNQDTYGDNQGLRFEYRYTANAAGTAEITASSVEGNKSMHLYGFSNREADPTVGLPPVITAQPTGKTIGLGQPLSLQVGATGSATLTYQWKRNGSNIPGATDALLDLGEAEFAESGNYSVVVSNSVNTVTSNTATVVVLDNVPGLSGTGLGADGMPLNLGVVDPHFTLITNPDNPGSPLTYVQSNLPGAWLANSATSRWIGPRADTSAAAALNADDGEGPGVYVYRTKIDLTNFSLSTVKIQGSWATDNKGLEIRINGVAVTGQTNVGDTFQKLTPFVIDSTNAPGLTTGINTLDFVVNNEDAVTGFTGLRVDGLTAIGEIPPNTPPHIALQPVGGNGAHFGSFTLSVAASGSPTMTYQWLKDDVAIIGATDPELVLYIDDATPAGSYKVKVSNGNAPDAISDTVAVTVTNAPPVTVSDELTTPKNTPLLIDPISSLLANDTDADLDTLVLDGFSATSYNGGTITEASGILTYKPATGFVGLDGFNYTISDGWGGTASGSVIITVVDVSAPPSQLKLVVDLTGGTVNGTFTGTAGVTYILQRSTTLTSDWVDIDTVVAPPSGAVAVEDANPPAGKAFYRIAYPD